MRFHPVEWHDSLPSTNTYLCDLVKGNPSLPSGTIIAARHQTAGKGRYDRTWISNRNRDLAFSILVRWRVQPETVPSISMAAALGVAEAFQEMGLRPRVKWPNDVLLDGKKVCGILSELVSGTGGNRPTIVVGIGVNVNMNRQEAARIDQPATSLSIQTGKQMDVRTVLDALVEPLPGWIERWEAGGFEGIRKDWKRRVVGLDEPVTIGEGDHQKSGTLTGFGPDGELILTDNDGKKHTIVAGDLTIG